MCAPRTEVWTSATLGVIRAGAASNLRAMESPAAAHSAIAGRASAAARGRARGACRSCSGATPDGPAHPRPRARPRAGHRRARARGRHRASTPTSRSRACTPRSSGSAASGRSPTTASRATARSSTASASAAGGGSPTATSCASGPRSSSSGPRQPSPSSATIAAPEGAARPGADRDPAPDPGRALPAVSRRQPATRPRRPTSRSPTRSSSRVDAVKGHLRALFEKFGIGDLPQNQKRVRLVELGAAQRRDLGPRPRMSDGTGATGPALGRRVRRPPDRGGDRRGRHGGRLPRPQPRPRPRAGAQGAEPRRSRPTPAFASASGASRGWRPRSSTRT